jgi:hypothetical protein
VSCGRRLDGVDQRIEDPEMTRADLARLLECFEQIEQHARAARELLFAALRRVDQPLPRTREMIVAVLQAVDARGQSRAGIIAAIRRGYGVQLPPNTATVTLHRMQRAGVIRCNGRKWSLVTARVSAPE